MRTGKVAWAPADAVAIAWMGDGSELLVVIDETLHRLTWPEGERIAACDSPPARRRGVDRPGRGQPGRLDAGTPCVRSIMIASLMHGRDRPDAAIEPLSEHEDAFGRLLLDYLAGEAGQMMLELDDGRAGPALAADVFFAEHRDWPAPEQHVFEFARGRVLDVGCGAGRHSLEAQSRALGVVAIDISPGAIEVCRQRGVRDARLLPLAAVDASPGIFETVLMMCGNFGLVGTAAQAVLVLQTLHGITTRSARIVLDSIDPDQDDAPADLAYQRRNRVRGRLPGQVTMRLRYGDSATPWFELLNLSPRELEALAAEAGWRLGQLVEGEPPEYYAVLEKTDRTRARR